MTDTELARLYEQYGYVVHRRCMALLGNSSDAEDALQETFLRVKRYSASPTKGSELSWLYSIASNCAYDIMNKRKRETLESPETLPRLDRRSVGSGEDPDRRAMIGAVLRRLDERTRNIGVLHYLDGYTQEEVAAQTGYSRRTVGKKLKIFEDLFRSSWFGGSSGSPEDSR